MRQGTREGDAMSDDQKLREHLRDLLGGGQAHVDFEAVIRDFPVAIVSQRVAHVPYTAWQVLEHMRIAQWDILEFIRNGAHVSPPWPEGYWPADDIDAGADDWNRSVAAFRADLETTQQLVADTATDLFAPIPHGDGQTVLREALLVADHNAYHLGVMVMLKRILSI
jgi:hypothetical protein